MQVFSYFMSTNKCVKFGPTLRESDIKSTPVDVEFPNNKVLRGTTSLFADVFQTNSIHNKKKFGH